MKSFIIAATVICMTIILPTATAILPIPGPGCHCSCPTQYDQFTKEGSTCHCPKCPPPKCNCRPCIPNVLTAEVQTVQTENAEAIFNPAERNVDLIKYGCNCPKCPPIIHPKLCFCACPQIMCLCMDCATAALQVV